MWDREVASHSLAIGLQLYEGHDSCPMLLLCCASVCLAAASPLLRFPVWVPIAGRWNEEVVSCVTLLGVCWTALRPPGSSRPLFYQIHSARCAVPALLSTNFSCCHSASFCRQQQPRS